MNKQKNTVSTTFNRNGKLPSHFQKMILDYVQFVAKATNVGVPNQIQGKQFRTRDVVNHFVNLGYKRGSISSALNILKNKGWLCNQSVPGFRWKVWYC